MTLTWVAEHSVGLGWTLLALAFLMFAVGGALYRRWLRHESADKAETKRVLGPPPTTHPNVDHRWDAL